jgi:inner membrane protein
MQTGAHLVISWVSANVGTVSRRERIACALCGVVPDIDGLGMVVDLFAPDLHLYETFHHKIAHNLILSLVLFAVVYAISKRAWPACLGVAIYLTHLFFDCLGSGAPNGEIWPIYPFWPFSNYEYLPAWQWELSDIRNSMIAAVFVVVMLMIARRTGRSPIEIVSRRLDGFVIKTIRGLLGSNRGAWESSEETKDAAASDPDP